MLPVLDFSSNNPLYMQVYSYIKFSILEGSLKADEKLPSLRNLALQAGISVTTIELAYNQLLVEGYVRSQPKSGYFVNKMEVGILTSSSEFHDFAVPSSIDNLSNMTKPQLFSDLTSFDFIKWKKCINTILNEFPGLLLSEGEPQGEFALRSQISRYIYNARGVKCSPNQIVIGAGTQQLMNILSIVLIQTNITNVCFEDPGFSVSRNSFLDRGFAINSIPVTNNGIKIEALPTCEKAAVYVSPSNQFPMGFVMPISRRYKLLDWAKENNSIIIEDDYDSELRYFGKPIPSLKSLEKDGSEKVVYLGSFSSTLFNSIKISYMVLPNALLDIFIAYSKDYNQTCSKLEQLTLSLYMQKGYYQTNIRKLRSLYSQKAHLISDLIYKNFGNAVEILNSNSGVHMLLKVHCKKTKEQLCEEAAALGISVLPVSNYTLVKDESNIPELIFYYTRIPLSHMPSAISNLKSSWFE